MAPRFEIRGTPANTGPTDNSGLDSLWIVHLSEPDGEPQTFRFSVPSRHGVPTPDELCGLIRGVASGFHNERSALEQFRARERSHPDGSDRRVVFLTPQG